MNKNYLLPDILGALIIALFVHTVYSKLYDFHLYALKMSGQPLNHTLSSILVYAIPTLESASVILLIFRRTQLWGFIIALLLMISFTGYVGLILNNFYGRVPCTCGGAIENLSWGGHLILNIVFTLFAGIGVVYNLKRRNYYWLDHRKLKPKQKNISPA